MLHVETRHAVHQDHARQMTTAELRQHFLVEGLFVPGEIRLVYTHYDRFVVGGAVPGDGTLMLDRVAETRTPNFLDRREMGVVNIGQKGEVKVGGQSYELGHGDVLYIGMGGGAVEFSGGGRFYLTSAPAHHAYPTRLITIKDSTELNLGAPETSNQRTINQFIHPTVMESCQLVLGYTRLAPGSVWNTMPAHVHDRRMEAYLYYDLAPDARVAHFMGEPQETRHLFVANEEGALSPPWSIHSGAGTGNYTFIWAMAGDNIDYTDMDFVQAGDLR